MPLTKAVIEIDATDWDSSRIPQQRLTVQFNPTEYTIQKGAQIAEIAIPGIDSPILQFVRGQNEKLTLDLFFDTTEENGMADGATDVRARTKPFHELVKVQPKSHAVPRFTFVWGKGLSFRAIAESVSEKFTLFSPEGIPLRCTLSLSLREYKTLEQQLKELNLQSADHTKRVIVQRGDSLGRIAWDQYRDARQWRRIADFNRGRIADPRRLDPGTVLEIPPIDAAETALEGGA
jgi:hypothetical protein